MNKSINEHKYFKVRLPITEKNLFLKQKNIYTKLQTKKQSKYSSESIN